MFPFSFNLADNYFIGEAELKPMVSFMPQLHRGWEYKGKVPALSPLSLGIMLSTRWKIT